MRKNNNTISWAVRLLTVMGLWLWAAIPASAQNNNEWQLVWSDEFDGSGPYDATVWEPERGFVRNHEAQWYQGDNAFRENGFLVIEGRKQAPMPVPSQQGNRR